jgi:hypothetical protein
MPSESTAQTTTTAPAPALTKLPSTTLHASADNYNDDFEDEISEDIESEIDEGSFASGTDTGDDQF